MSAPDPKQSLARADRKVPANYPHADPIGELRFTRLIRARHQVAIIGVALRGYRYTGRVARGYGPADCAGALSSRTLRRPPAATAS